MRVNMAHIIVHTHMPECMSKFKYNVFHLDYFQFCSGVLILFLHKHMLNVKTKHTTIATLTT